MLAIFDVDGTISDSQHHITHAMALGFEAVGLKPLPASEVLSIVGLSLPEALMRLLPDAPQATRDAVVEGYKASYKSARAASPAPLYAGAKDMLDRLHGRADTVLAVATGKSRRGLRALVEHHGLERHFQSLQCADDHPSKPHPAMVQAALDDTGMEAAQAVMIGDTSYDIEMGRAAGLRTIGVAWGYHPLDALAAAGVDHIVHDFNELEALLTRLTEGMA